MEDLLEGMSFSMEPERASSQDPEPHHSVALSADDLHGEMEMEMEMEKPCMEGSLG